MVPVSRHVIRSRAGGAAARPDVDVAVIGAGPHGLSAAVHLRRAGVDAQGFGDPMSFWRGMPTGMSLRSNMSATNMVEPTGPLSLAELHAARTGCDSAIRCRCVASSTMGYGCSATASPTSTGDGCSGWTAAGGGFALELGRTAARVSAARVVVACGIAALRPASRRALTTCRSSWSHTPATTMIPRSSPASASLVVGGRSERVRVGGSDVRARRRRRSGGPRARDRLAAQLVADPLHGPAGQGRLRADRCRPAVVQPSRGHAGRCSRGSRARLRIASPIGRSGPRARTSSRSAIDGITLHAGTRVTDAQEHGAGAAAQSL